MKKSFIMIFKVCMCLLLVGCESNTINNNENKQNNMNSNVSDTVPNDTNSIENDTVQNNVLNELYYVDEEIIEKSEKIIIKDALLDEVKKITEEKSEIKEILNTLNCGKKINGATTSEMHTWRLEAYNGDGNLIFKAYIWKSGQFGIERDKEYSFNIENYDLFRNYIDE